MQVPYKKDFRFSKRPFEQRELIFTVSEIARTLGVSETHLQSIPKVKLLIAIGGRLSYQLHLVHLPVFSVHTRLLAFPQNMPSGSASELEETLETEQEGSH